MSIVREYRSQNLKELYMSVQFFSSALVWEDTLSLWEVELDPSLLENFFFVNCHDAFQQI